MGILSEHRSQGFGRVSLEEIKVYSKKMAKSKIILSDRIIGVGDKITIKA